MQRVCMTGESKAFLIRYWSKAAQSLSTCTAPTIVSSHSVPSAHLHSCLHSTMLTPKKHANTTENTSTHWLHQNWSKKLQLQAANTLQMHWPWRQQRSLPRQCRRTASLKHVHPHSITPAPPPLGCAGHSLPHCMPSQCSLGSSMPLT